MKKICVTITLCLLNWSIVFSQQPASTDYSQLLQQLEWELMAGNKWALRDLGSLLNKENLRPRVLNLLSENTLFLAEEVLINDQLSKDQFLDFFYSQEADIDFSVVSDVFYLTPPGKQQTPHKIIRKESKDALDISSSLRLLAQDFDAALAGRKPRELIRIIKEFGALKNKEAYQFLLTACNDKIKAISQPQRQKVYTALFEVLQNYRDNHCLETLLQLVNNQRVSPQFAAPYLTRLTNISVSEDGDFQSLTDRYAKLIDSLHSLESMRLYGYEKLFNYRQNFFELPVDYYGRLLSDSRSYSWIRHNAIADLAASEHPRALYYLAAQVYKFRDRRNHSNQHDLNQYVDLINDLTGQEISFGASELGFNASLSVPGDNTAKRSFFIYWSGHYSDYEWDPNHHIFTNKLEAAEITQNYEKLFRRLPSKNDSAAFAAFKQLTEGDPGQIIELTQKYRQLLRNYNPTLPSFQYQFLEQLTLLTDYCRRNNFSYKASPAMTKMLQQLRDAENPKERYQSENKIISQLTLKDVTAIEYWACLHENLHTINFSIGRILDRFYSKHWDDIVQQDDQLRLYLKKSYLFENIGVLGICNAYLRKFDISDPMIQERLTALIKVETDNEIGNQIMQLIDEPETEEQFGLEDFLEDPLSFSRREIKILPSPNMQESRRIVELMKSSEELDLVKIFFYYLRLHPAIEEVPYLFTMIDDDRVLSNRKGNVITVGSNIIPIIEDVYNYHYPSEDGQRYNVAAWKNKWQQDQANYKNWGAFFFEEKIKQLSAQEEIDIEDLNLITESSYFKPEYKKICLEVLGKVRPVKNIKRLNIEPKLSPTEDLVYFAGIDFSRKDLDDIPKLFTEDHPELMLNFIMEKSADFEVSGRGSFYNDLFRAPWFAGYINSGKADEALASKIKETLKSYLEESEFISEFEEQTTNFNIAQIQTIGKPLRERLEAATHPDMEEGSRIKIQQSIIATISYEEIPIVIDYLDQLTVPQGARAYDFLHKDFGLPIFDLDNPQELVKRHASTSEYDFYQYYLDQFGVKYKNGRGKLDYQHIYDILQFDIVSPFVGENGGKRDDYTYGIIKLLELTFDTTLGFHKKLNEGQTFYTFSSAKRASAWMSYLEEHELVPRKEIIPMSYNLVREEN